MKDIPPITDSEPGRAAREWFARLSDYCANIDYTAAEAICAPDIVSFGTKADIVEGLAPLRENQWEGIWPNIAGFKIDLDSIHAGGSTDHAWGIAVWTSSGFDEQGQSFNRPGRASVILQRRQGIWLAIHTHFSLIPGTPARTFGRTQGIVSD